MKKYHLFFALSIMCAMFASCTSKEQKAATEYLKGTMKSPSSFKVISIEEDQMEARSSYDTLYHVSKLYEHSFYSLHYVDSIKVDSIKIMRTDYPAYTNVFIEYDAANSYGAIIRDSEFVVVYNGDACSLSDFIKNYGVESLDHYEAHSTTLKNNWDNDSIKEGDWISLWNLGIF
jgi:hypothetical protein